MHDNSNNQNLSGSISVGVGRVRDATSVYQTQVLEQRLLRTGALKRRLSRDAIRQLAKLFSMQGDFGLVHDYPGKHFWREVERILRENGSLAGESLDA